MATPSRLDVHVDVPLTTLSLAFVQGLEGFVAPQVFPEVPVDRASDKYFTYDRSYWHRAEMAPRAIGAESAGADYGLSTDSYACQVYAIHKDVPDQLRANADSALALDREAAEFCAQQSRLRQELDWAKAYFSAGVWTGETDGVAATPSGGEAMHWSDANGDPIGDIRGAATAMHQRTGLSPNVLVLSRPVFDALVDRSDLVERIKYTAGPENPAIVTRQALAGLFGLDRVLVMEAVQETAGEGLATSPAFVGGKHALLAHAAPRPGLMTPSAGYTFVWRGYQGADPVGGPSGIGIRRFRLEHLRADRIEAEVAFDHKLVSADLGHFWSGIVP